MERTKTLRQIWAQLGRIVAHYDAQGATPNPTRIKQAERICARYGCNMVDWMRTRMSFPELDAYAETTIVPMEIYTQK